MYKFDNDADFGEMIILGNEKVTFPSIDIIPSYTFPNLANSTLISLCLIGSNVEVSKST